MSPKAWRQKIARRSFASLRMAVLFGIEDFCHEVPGSVRRRAAEILLDRLEGRLQLGDPQRRLMAPELVIRGSTGPGRGDAGRVAHFLGREEAGA